jgi:hypothetical protein
MDILSSEHNKTATTMRERVRRRLRRQQTHAEAAMYFLVSTIIYSSTGRILYANAEDAAYGSSSSYGSSGYASGSSSSGSSSGSSGSSGSSSSSSNSASTSTTKGQLVVQPFCKKTNVRVTAVYLTCDSPGAYYYGSGNYRNSLVCMSDDKVNLRVECKFIEIELKKKIQSSALFRSFDLFKGFAPQRVHHPFRNDFILEDPSSFSPRYVFHCILFHCILFHCYSLRFSLFYWRLYLHQYRIGSLRYFSERDIQDGSLQHAISDSIRRIVQDVSGIWKLCHGNLLYRAVHSRLRFSLYPRRAFDLYRRNGKSLGMRYRGDGGHARDGRPQGGARNVGIGYFLHCVCARFCAPAVFESSTAQTVGTINCAQDESVSLFSNVAQWTGNTPALRRTIRTITGTKPTIVTATKKSSGVSKSTTTRTGLEQWEWCEPRGRQYEYY